MIDVLEFFARLFMGVLRVLESIFRFFRFIDAIRWLLSRNYREKLAKQPWYNRWSLIEGLIDLLLVSAVLVIGLMVFITNQF